MREDVRTDFGDPPRAGHESTDDYESRNDPYDADDDMNQGKHRQFEDHKE